MRIIIDIGHPGHVHYFRNFGNIMMKNGHSILFIARDKEVTFKLLDKYDIPYVERGKGGKNLLTKLLYIPLADYKIFLEALKFKPDLFLSFGSTYAGHVAFLLGKPHIAFDDTEHAIIEHLLYRPVTTCILNPTCFKKKMGDKQIFFDSYMELCYLHKNYFDLRRDVLNDLGVKNNEKFAIIRFVSWNANHDVGQKGLTIEDKRQLIFYLNTKMKVFISSECSLPQEFEKYRFRTSPDKFHSALAYSSLYIGEGGTTASEAVMLGTPTIYINSLMMGYLKDAEEAGLLDHFVNFDGVIDKIDELLKIDNLYDVFQEKKNDFLNDKIDPTSFMVWFIENYPESIDIMKKNPDYQYRFK